jgi:hypothetical protein
MVEIERTMLHLEAIKLQEMEESMELMGSKTI